MIFRIPPHVEIKYFVNMDVGDQTSGCNLNGTKLLQIICGSNACSKDLKSSILTPTVVE